MNAGKDQPDPVVPETTFRPTVAMADVEMQRQWTAVEQQRLELKGRETDLKQRDGNFGEQGQRSFSKLHTTPQNCLHFLIMLKNLFAMYEVTYNL